MQPFFSFSSYFLVNLEHQSYASHLPFDASDTKRLARYTIYVLPFVFMYNVTSNTASFVRDVLRSDVVYDVPVAFTYKWMYAATSLISTFTIEKSIGC